MRVVHSIGEPHIELIAAVEGTVFQTAPGSNWHHVGCWSDDLDADVADLEARGYTREAWGRGDSGQLAFFAYLVSPIDYRVEVVNAGYRPEYESVWTVPDPGVS